MTTETDLPNRRWSRGSLRVWSKTTTPRQVAAALGFHPTTSHHLNDIVGGREHVRRQHHLFSWSPEVSEAEPLAVHLAAICDRIEPVVIAIHALPDCEADIFCGYSSENGQGGTTLPPLLLARLAAIQLDVVLDLFPPPATSRVLEALSEEPGM